VPRPRSGIFAPVFKAARGIDILSEGYFKTTVVKGGKKVLAD
jgi:hypothetical protein